MVLQEEGNESQEGEDMEGEVEYLEVEELDELQYREADHFDHKPDLEHMQWGPLTCKTYDDFILFTMNMETHIKHMHCTHMILRYT